MSAAAHVSVTWSQYGILILSRKTFTFPTFFFFFSPLKWLKIRNLIRASSFSQIKIEQNENILKFEVKLKKASKQTLFN